VLTVRQAQEDLGLRTHRGAKLNVDKLVEMGILRPQGQEGGERLYAADDILAILTGKPSGGHDTEVAD